MKWVNATQGILEHPPTIVIASDRSHLEGLLYARVFNELYDGAKISLTIRPIQEDFGGCDARGQNHTGVLKDLLLSKFDFSYLNYDQLNCPDLSKIQIGPILVNYQQSIGSLKEPTLNSEELTADFTEIFKSVSPEIYALFALTVIFILILWKNLEEKVEKSETQENLAKNFLKRKNLKFSKTAPSVGWNMVAISLNQFSGNPRQSAVRLIVISFLLIIFWIFQYLFASFTSDLSITRAPSAINNLNDLANSKNYTAMFIAEHNTWKIFKISKDKIMKKVWNNAMKKYKNESLVANKLEKGPMEAYRMVIEDKRAGISTRNIIRFMTLIHCTSYDEKEKQSTIHEAFDPFLPALKGVVAFGPNIKPQAKERIEWAARVFFEKGLSDYYDRNPQGILNLPFSQQVSCMLKLEESKHFDEQTENPRPLKPGNFASFSWILSLFIIFAILVLCFEKFEESRNLKKN